MDDGDDVEDHLGPPEKIARLPGRQTRSFRTNEGKFVSFLPDEEAGPARPSSIRRLGAA